MSEKIFEVEAGFRLVIERVSRDLTIKGWNQEKVKIQDWTDQDDFQEEDTAYRLTFSGDAVLYAPHNLAVKIHKVEGDAVIKGLRETLEIKKVGGDLYLSDLGGTNVSSVGGDLFAKYIRGDLSVQKVGGDCTILDVDGQLSTAKTGGDLILNAVGGGIEARAGGDINAQFSPVSWQAYALQAGGDLTIQFPEDLNAEVNCVSKNGSIILNLGDDHQTLTRKKYQKTFGEGGSSIDLQAGGEIILATKKETWSPKFDFQVDLDPDFSGFSEEFTTQTINQLEKQLDGLDSHLQESLAGLSETLNSLGVPDQKIQEMQEKIAKSSQDAARRVEKITRKTRAKIEKKAAQVQSRAGEKHWGEKRFDLDSFLKNRGKSASLEEEQMMILQMLQDKKISADQANDLLSALEKRS